MGHSTKPYLESENPLALNSPTSKPWNLHDPLKYNANETKWRKSTCVLISFYNLLGFVTLTYIIIRPNVHKATKCIISNIVKSNNFQFKIMVKKGNCRRKVDKKSWSLWKWQLKCKFSFIFVFHLSKIVGFDQLWTEIQQKLVKKTWCPAFLSVFHPKLFYLPYYLHFENVLE